VARRVRGLIARISGSDVHYRRPGIGPTVGLWRVSLVVLGCAVLWDFSRFKFDGYSCKFSAIFFSRGQAGTTFAYEIERATGKKEG
jgi:hypothetical protein